MRIGLLAAALLGLMACNQDPPSTAVQRVLSFQLQDSVTADIDVVVTDDHWTVYNGEEAIELRASGTQTYHVPVFNGTIHLDSPIEGYWIDSLRPGSDAGPYRVDFQLINSESKEGRPVSGTWDVWFGESDTESPARAQLDLVADTNRIAGTVRTPTGDYRFLSGRFDGTRLVLQTFDGAHLFRFDAELDGSNWSNGRFYSGNHYQTNWSAKPAEPWEATVELAQIRPPLDSLFVRYLDETGTPQTQGLLPAEGQVKIVDILGTWCPNCMDEVRLLTQFNVPSAELLSVAFERPESPEEAYQRIQSFKREMGVDWDVLWGGKANKQIAADAFPFLDEVISFPTTLFIQSDGTVHVHSGFNGPATGQRYLEEQAVFKLHSTPATSLENR